MQPAQLSLLPDPCPAPPLTLLAQLPEGDIAAAITLLARLIAKASVPDAEPLDSGRQGQVSVDE